MVGWALQGYSAFGDCKDALRLGTARILCIGYCMDTLRLDTARRAGRT